jgi:ribose transport system permease protein
MGALIALLVLMSMTGIFEPAFLKPTNLTNILNQQAVVGVIAVGMTLVIILGGIDLSVGSLLALAGGAGVMALNARFDPQGAEWSAIGIAIVVTLAVGLAAGVVNGVLIAKGGIAPFIATLGGLVAYRSAATWIANGGQFFVEQSQAFRQLGHGFNIPGTNIARAGAAVREYELPYSILVFIGIALAGSILLNFTRYGRYVYAIGCSERAAIYSAIPVARIKIMTYALIGLATGLAAVLHATRYNSVNSANAGLLMELEAIAAVVIGGTRMQGGAGGILGTVIGVILLGVIRNVQVMLGLESHASGVVMGVIIIAAVLFQRLGRRE